MNNSIIFDPDDYLRSKVYQYKNFMNENANLSSKNAGEVCLLAYSFRWRTDIVALNGIMALFSWVSLVLMFFLCKNKQSRKLWKLIGLDLKIIVFAGFSCIAIGNFNSFLFFGYKFIYFFWNSPTCNYIWTGFGCYVFQIAYMSLFIRGFFVFHLGLFIERFVITIVGLESRFRGWLGVLLGIAMYANSYSNVVFMDPKLYQNNRVYCSSLYTSIDSSVSASSIAYLILDMIVTLMDFILFAYNNRRLQKYKRQSSNFNLNRSFAFREMQLSISVIYPFSLIHSIGYVLQLGGYIYYTKIAFTLQVHDGIFAYELVNFARIFCNLILILFLLAQSEYRSRQSSTLIWSLEPATQTDLHFKELRRIFI